MRRGKIEPVVDGKAWQNYCIQCKAREVFWYCGRVQTIDIIQKIEQTLKNTYTTKQKRTNNGFRNTNARTAFFSRENKGQSGKVLNPVRVLCFMFSLAFLDLTVENVQELFHHFNLTD